VAFGVSIAALFFKLIIIIIICYCIIIRWARMIHRMLSRGPPDGWSSLHVHQTASWDCGLACVVSACRRCNLRDPDLGALLKRFPARSVWSVDLALLLREHGVSVVFYTTCCGVNADHAALPFYRLFDDAPRVEAAFNTARASGLRCCQLLLPLDHMCQHLAAQSAVYVALVDVRYLSCFRCTSPLRRLLFSYAGHFIVLWKYDKDARTVDYMDPSSSCGEWTSSLGVLNLCAPGTVPCPRICLCQ
jgi:hypothetical protein